MELDPKYVDVVVQRWQTLSGKKAKLEGDGRTFEEIARGTAEGGAVNRSLPPGDRGRGIQLRAGHPDVEGLCLALVDWSAELRLLQASQGLATVAPRLAHVGSSCVGLACRPSLPWNWLGAREEMQRFDRRSLKESSMGASRVFGAKHHAPSQRFEKDTGAYVPD